jgi:hypothetical protein
MAREPWMTNDQWECAQLFADVVGGFHHVTGEFKAFGEGIAVSDTHGRWATFDYDRLTRLVVLAHDRMIRVDLVPSGPGRVGFTFWKRHTREGSMFERHPTMEQAIAMHRRGR